MARPIRIERAGGWYHVTARGNERKEIFRDPRDRQHFLEVLAEMISRFRVRLHAFVLMDNHYHLLLELREANLSRSVQWLNGSYGVWFNRRHGRSGHLFAGRFKSVIVSPEEWGLELSRYVHLNPVRTGRLGLSKGEQKTIRQGLSAKPQARRVAERIAALRRYRWSSYRAYIGTGKQPDWLVCEAILKWGGGPEREQRKCYREYVESGVREGLARSPWEEVKDQVIMGGAAFLNQVRQSVSGDQREQRRARKLAVVCPGMRPLIESVERLKGEKWEEFRDRHGDEGRDLVLYLGQTWCGMKLT